MILSKEVKLPFIEHVLKSTENTPVKTKRKNMRTISVKVLFQAASEIYLIHRGKNNKTLVILVPFNSSGECTFKKKSKNDSSAIEEKET